jgi:hypothetical protein
MIAAPKERSTTLHNTLRRIEALTDRLDRVADPQAREAAHELLGLMLDLHGLALARLVSVVAAVADSAASDALIADPYVCAILLLHGLHPRDAQTRLDQVIADMQPQWQERGFHVGLLGISAGTARVRLYKNGSSEPCGRVVSRSRSPLIRSRARSRRHFRGNQGRGCGFRP